MYISPYEVHPSRCTFFTIKVFVERPESYLFKFDPHEIMIIDLKRFKKIE
jgi:hypothetical protein